MRVATYTNRARVQKVLRQTIFAQIVTNLHSRFGDIHLVKIEVRVWEVYKHYLGDNGKLAKVLVKSSIFVQNRLNRSNVISHLLLLSY